jgi:hypothetical protein
MVPVSMNLSTLKGWNSKKEDFIMNQKRIQEQMIVLGSEIASSLLKQ